MNRSPTGILCTMNVEPLHHSVVPARRTGGKAPERIVLLHGFTQNGECWGALPHHLADHGEVILVDAPGHGRSANDQADLWTAADLIAQAGERAHYVGYSMGGRMALHLALSHPELVQSLTLIGATAGIDDAADRSARRRADEALAERLLTNGLPAFLDGWLANPLFTTLPDAAACRDERLRNRPEGLAASLRHVGTGTQEPLWERLSELSAPVLVVAGSLDQKFTALGHRLVEQLPNATFASERGGHAIHSEQPGLVAARIGAFLQSVRQPER